MPCEPGARLSRRPAGAQEDRRRPCRGTAELGFIQTAKLEGNDIVTTFQVKNMSATNAIVGLQISEFWYDKAGTPLQGTGDRQRLRDAAAAARRRDHHPASPKVAGMTTPQYKFEHNNGTVKPVKLKQRRAEDRTEYLELSRPIAQ